MPELGWWLRCDQARACTGRTRLSPSLKPYLSGMRMAATPATAYRAYRSKMVSNPDTTTWVQIDLGSTIPVDFVLLYPASEKMYPGRDQYYAGEGFPAAVQDRDLPTNRTSTNFRIIADFTAVGFSRSRRQHHAVSRRADITRRYVRLTATQSAAREGAARVCGSPAEGLDRQPRFHPDAGEDRRAFRRATISRVGCTVTADPEHGNPELLKQLTRPPRQDGETIQMDHPDWSPIRRRGSAFSYKAEAPKSGVTLDGGLFQAALTHNAQYLLNSYTDRRPASPVLREEQERSRASSPPDRRFSGKKTWPDRMRAGF